VRRYRISILMLSAGQNRTVIFSLLLMAATLAFYQPIVHNQFTEFDDAVYILRNPQVQAGLNWQMLKWSFTTFHAGYWHPVTWISHAIDCRLFGLNPVGHHYVNLLLQATNAVLLFLLLQYATGLAWPSLIVSAIFALHPLNVESVAWVAERKNLLSMTFFLLALLLYTRYGQTGRRPDFWMVVLLFALGLMAKPQIVTLPFVLVLWDYWPLERWATRSGDENTAAPSGGHSFLYLLLEKWPLFILAAADSVITVIAQRSGGAVRTAAEVSLGARFDNAVVCYARYLGKVFWPSRLAPLYPHPGNSIPVWQVVVAAALLLVISIVVIVLRDRRYLLVGWFWFLGTLVPMIGLVTVGEQAMADRFAYIPLIGVLLVFVWAAGDLAESFRIPLGVPIMTALVVGLAMGVVTYRQLHYWRDDETLWRYTLSVTDGNYMAHDNLALALRREGRSDEAVAEFRAANALHRYPANQVLTLALFELRVGHPQEAVEECDTILRAPNQAGDSEIQAVAFSERGQGLLQLQRYDEARESLENALRLSPENGMALIGSGVLEMRVGNFDGAARHFARSAAFDSSPVSLLLLAQALRRDGHAAQADSALVEAQRISSDLGGAQISAGQFLAFVGLKPI
jgi:protein O-mannosyl-transferase